MEAFIIVTPVDLSFDDIATLKATAMDKDVTFGLLKDIKVEVPDLTHYHVIRKIVFTNHVEEHVTCIKLTTE